MTDLLKTRRRLPPYLASPQVSHLKETDHLCTVCNRILIRVPGMSVCTCANGHLHNFPEFTYRGDAFGRV